METIYVKIRVKQLDKGTNDIRNAGLFFSNIAEALDLDRDSITEIDEDNYLPEIKNIRNKFRQ